MKSTKNLEVKDILISLKDRLQDGHLEYIIVDDCCKSRELYQEIFGDIPVKLDCFHAIQRLTKCFPKKFPDRKRVCNEMSYIIRQKGNIIQNCS